MPRLGTADDAARSVLNLIRGMSGEHVTTRGGTRHGARTRKSAIKKKQLSSGSVASGGGTTDGGSGSGTFTSPLTAAWSLIRGGLGGSLVELPLGPEGTVLASRGGKLEWVYLADLGVPVSYLTFMDGETEYDLTDASGVPIWA